MGRAWAFRGLAAVIGAAVLAAACGGGSPDQGTSTVALAPYGLRGRVVTSSGVPLAEASIKLMNVSDGSEVTETTSHHDGWFAFLVFNGRYRLDVAVSGYEVSPL